MPNRQTIKSEVMGEWLETLAPWDVFATWTFSWGSDFDPEVKALMADGVRVTRARLVTANGAVYWARRILAMWEEMAGQPIYGFWGVEVGNVGKLVHIHALVGNVAHLKSWCGVKLSASDWGVRCCLLHSWPCGYSRVLRYEAGRGATDYVSKYVSKDISEWGLVGLPLETQRAAR